MQFSTTLIAIFAAVAIASPTGETKSKGKGMSSKQASMQCNSTQTLKCCNTSQKDAILPISVSCLNIDLVSAAGSLSGQCSGNNNQAFCCSNNQEGVININAGCTPINIASA